MRHDYENIPDGARVMLYPSSNNPLHKDPVRAFYTGGYFYCDGSPHEEGPDYTTRSAIQYTEGFEAMT